MKRLSALVALALLIAGVATLDTLLFAQKITHGVTLSWTWTGTGTPSYSVYRATTSGAEAKPALVTGLASPTYVDTTAVVGQQYYYTATATVGGVESAPSVEVGALIVVPTSPTSPSTAVY